MQNFNQLLGCKSWKQSMQLCKRVQWYTVFFPIIQYILCIWFPFHIANLHFVLKFLWKACKVFVNCRDWSILMSIEYKYQVMINSDLIDHLSIPPFFGVNGWLSIASDNWIVSFSWCQHSPETLIYCCKIDCNDTWIKIWKSLGLQNIFGVWGPV